MIAQDQLIGTRFEKCVVERLIGRGGYGLTYLAFDEELQEHRVIKVSQDNGLDEASRRRHLKTFLEEGLILSRLKHPQIVTLRGQGDKHGHRYMILDYIQGFSLRALLDIVAQRQSELGCAWQDLIDPVTASALILSALYPLEYAHRANVHLPDREIFGVAHRDISPGNLILGVKGNEKGRLVLIDFGTAKTALTENVTVDQNLVGTIPYMGKARLQKANSPEEKAQYQDFWKDFRETQHDIHAIGVLYYQLLTGRLPFYGETSPQIIIKILDPEVYSQCHLEIASAHSFASGVLRKCLVYHDFSVPLSEQPYQYPDAASMRPDMEEVFHTLSGGRTVNDILIGLGKKLAHPELLMPVDGRQPTDQASSGVMPTLLQPLDYASGLRHPAKRRSPLVYVAASAVCLALTLGAAWQFGPGHSRPDAALPAAGMTNPRTATAQNAERETGGHETLERLDGPTQPAGSKVRPLGDRTLGVKSEKGIATAGAKAGSPHGTGPGARSGEAARAADAARLGALAGLGTETGDNVGDADWGKEGFVRVQTLVREEDPAAFEKISALLAIKPESPDLRLLRSQLMLARNPASPDARRDLVSLLSARPEFMHPSIFHEQVMYLLWQTDAATYEAQKTPGNRINVLKSANAYISEFQPNEAYQLKVKGIRDRLPH
ncbi:MAG: pknB [Fibrobacteres bacterium]|nr:pknB [Fibrobacterota bacterium]